MYVFETVTEGCPQDGVGLQYGVPELYLYVQEAS